MRSEIFLIGAGGFAREVLDVVEAHNATHLQGDEEHISVVGVVDDDPSALNLERIVARGYEYRGSLTRILEEQSSGSFLLGIGTPVVRKRLARRLERAGWLPKAVIHPDATIGSVKEIGPGTIICGGVQLSTNTRLGQYVHLNPNVTIGHDAVLEDFVSVNPAATVSGEVLVESQALIGAGAIVLQQLIVGRGATVGAGACVTKSVSSNKTVVGVPAQEIKSSFGSSASSSSEETQSNE